MKAQSLLDLKVMQKKFVDIAEVIPEDKLSWRPSADSRSYAEVLLHVAGRALRDSSFDGRRSAAGFDAKTYEKSTTNRDQIIKELDKSWDFTLNTDQWHEQRGVCKATSETRSGGECRRCHLHPGRRCPRTLGAMRGLRSRNWHRSPWT